MLSVFVAGVLLLGLPPAVNLSSGAPDLDRAGAATAEYAAALKAELMQAMRTGGAIEAVEVCHGRAGEIAHELSAKHGVKLSRVSLRNRNPGNAPREWQRQVLESFEARNAAGEPADSLVWHDYAEGPGGTEFRFMKAIPTGGVCLQCHGETLAPPLAEKLAELYPDDRATGFRAGDLRGAFVVTRDKEP